LASEIKRPRRAPGEGETPAQWCLRRGYSRSTWNYWRKLKPPRTPAVIQPGGPGGRMLITPAADAAWEAANTVATAAE
jgi:hypothetical protein